PGDDNCDPDQTYDPSYLYQVNTRTLEIERLVEVGSTPKFVACTPDGQTILVTNWCSGDLSVVDAELGVELNRVPLGNYPRGIAVDSKSRYAYVSLMGDDRIARVKLSDYSVEWLEEVGRTPRHLCLGPADRYLYISLSRPGEVAKMDLVSGKVIKRLEVGREVRTMALTKDGSALYAVSYRDDALIKVRTKDFTLEATVKTDEKPIGLTLDPETHSVWVACYTGSIMVFEDLNFPAPPAEAVVHHHVTPSRPEGTQAAVAYVPPGPDRTYNPYYHILPNPEEVPIRARGHLPAAPPEPVVTAAVPLPVAPPESETAARFHVIVGSFGDEANARKRMAELEKLGLHPVLLPTGTGTYRVSGVQFLGKASALQAMKEIKSAHNIDGWILRQ
ncbi:MAG: hypothetical protein D6722_09190, partial [Bacteroidetes bacterium]